MEDLIRMFCQRVFAAINDVTNRTTKQEELDKIISKRNERFAKRLDIGDKVQFPRLIYSHFGIFVGMMNITKEQDNIEQKFDGDIAHLTDLPTAQGLPFKKSIRPENNAIQLGHFLDIAGKSVALKNHELDRIYSPLPKEVIKGKAIEKLGNVGYNLFNGNCEHFANYCRYNRPISNQVLSLSALLTYGIFWTIFYLGKDNNLSLIVVYLAIKSYVFYFLF
ncbi:lecithin retinol acyltransferase-like isoform X1 [Biomphalaria pfeifferi]|uniref:Lecithin retinol acyltransferase-like isoform X1 n=1 Tax=Biomphalaria pfeifferi TaxID=112525 RepID=A0AAD8FHN4_BIOPF|nr:lecithin retinol acyltransferase-like isoform X1 [Biomphalaria pfeifferi]